MPASTGSLAGDAHAPKSTLAMRADFLSDITPVESKNQAPTPKLTTSAGRSAANALREAAASRYERLFGDGPGATCPRSGVQSRSGAAGSGWAGVRLSLEILAKMKFSDATGTP
jgi:hypothetical protein